ncbi:MAG: hypothetical protein IT285_03340 [Bdellovibrionales bacterium]|nr:hypothetical protein [Bdellovibrionales bacterium]
MSRNLLTSTGRRLGTHRVSGRVSAASRGSWKAALGGAIAASMLAGCSPEMFFGNDIDEGVRNTPRYREINTACAGLDLSRPELRIEDFKKIVNCFNANGGLQPVADLVGRLDDATLQPLVDWSNTQFLRNRKLMYELEKTYFSLQNRGILRPTFAQFGRLLGNEEFVASGIALLRESTLPDGSTAPEGQGPDPQLLAGLKRLSTKVTMESVTDAIDLGLNLVGARAFSAVQKRFEAPSPKGRELRDLTNRLHAYGLEMNRPERFDPARAALETVRDQSLFEALDRFMRAGAAGVATQSDIQARAARVGAIFQALHSGPAPEPAVGLVKLFHGLNRPIDCLRGAERVENALRWDVRELAEFTPPNEASAEILRRSPLTIAALAPFCDLPSALSEHYGSIRSVALTTGMEPMAELLRDAWATGRPGLVPTDRIRRPVVDLLLSLLADTNEAGTVGISRILPVMAELTDRGVWEDAVLIATLPPESERGKLADAADFVLEPAEELEGLSLYTVIVNVVSRTSALNLYRFARSLSRFVEEKDPIIEPALRSMRSALYVNQAHPFLDLARNILATAPEKQDFYKSVFRIADMPEFASSVKLIAEMAGDGRLERLVGSVITLFHKHAMEGNYGAIADAQEPAFAPTRRHDLVTADLEPYLFAALPDPEPAACGLMRPGFDLSDYGAADFEAQMGHTLSCLERGEDNSDFVNAINYLRRARLSSGRPFYEFQVDVVRSLGAALNAGELGDLSSRWKASFDSGKFRRLFDVVPYWAEEIVQGNPDDEGGPAIRPLLDAVAPLAAKRAELERLSRLGADVLLDDSFPNLVAYAEHIYDHPTVPDAPQAPAVFPVSRIKATLRARECMSNPTPTQPNPAWEARRAAEIVEDYTQGITNWDLVAGRARKAWTRQEFEACVGGPRAGITAPDWCQNSLFEKYSNRVHWDGDQSVAKASLNLLRYFTLAPGQRPDLQRHYPPEYLGEWFKKKADDYLVVSYIYPGQARPKVRMVNTLDRLELVLINADLDLDSIPKWIRDLLGSMMGITVPDNGAKHFLALVGEAWGDEPQEVWPLPIRNKYAGSRPPTLREAYVELRTTLVRLSNLLGFPDLPNCPGAQWPTANNQVPDWMVKLIGKHLDPQAVRSSLFNLMQVLPAVEEMLPDYNGPQRGSLKVLRDMFYELYYSSPPQFRNSSAKWRNNLSVILHLVRLGLGRQAGRLIRQLPASDQPALRDFFSTLARAAASPHAQGVMETLLQRDFEAAPARLFKDRPVGQIFLELFDMLEKPSSGLLSDERLDELEKRKCTGSASATLDQEWECKIAHAKQLSFYLLALVTQPSPTGGFAFGGAAGLVDPLALTLKDALVAHKTYLGARRDRLRELLTMKDPAGWIRALYESPEWSSKADVGAVLGRALGDSRHAVDALRLMRTMDEDPAAHAALELFADRWDALEKVEGYSEVELEPWVRDVVAFFKEDNVSSCTALAGTPSWDTDVHSACKLRHFAAQRLRANDLAAFLELIARGAAMDEASDYCQPSQPGCGPEQFSLLLKALSRQVRDGSVNDFLELVRRSLSQ